MNKTLAALVNTEKYLPIITLTAQLILGAIFIYASLDKIINPVAFVQIIESYQILLLSVVNVFAILLPWLELICGLLLLSGIWLRASATLISGILVMFIVAMGLVVARGLDIDCGCFESVGGTEKVGRLRIIEDLGFLILSIWIIRFPNSIFSIEAILVHSQTLKTEEVRDG